MRLVFFWFSFWCHLWPHPISIWSRLQQAWFKTPVTRVRRILACNLFLRILPLDICSSMFLRPSSGVARERVFLSICLRFLSVSLTCKDRVSWPTLPWSCLYQLQRCLLFWWVLHASLRNRYLLVRPLTILQAIPRPQMQLQRGPRQSRSSGCKVPLNMHYPSSRMLKWRVKHALNSCPTPKQSPWHPSTLSRSIPACSSMCASFLPGKSIRSFFV